MTRRTCFLVGLVVAVFVFPLQAQSVKDVRVVPGVATHMGQVASDHVVLHSVSIATDKFEFRRISSDGLADPSPFVVPADQVLVVTDVSVTSINVAPIDAILTQISIASLANPPVYESHLRTGLPGGSAATTEQMTSGFIVAPGQQIFALLTFVNTIVPSGQTTIIVRGYLAPNQ